MSREHPDHDDAELVLKLYDLRREAVMRESRDAIGRQFWPVTYEDFVAVSKPDHPLNAAFRQTSSYWEMVYGIARNGIAHADYLVENNGEGILLYAKIEPFLKRFRDEFSPLAFRSAEWVTTETEAGRRLLELFRGRLKTMKESLASKS